MVGSVGSGRVGSGGRSVIGGRGSAQSRLKQFNAARSAWSAQSRESVLVTVSSVQSRLGQSAPTTQTTHTKQRYTDGRVSPNPPNGGYIGCILDLTVFGILA